MTEGPLSGNYGGPAYGPADPYPRFNPVDLPPPDPRLPGPAPRRSMRSRLSDLAGSHRLAVEIGAVAVALLAGTGIGFALDGGGPGTGAASPAPSSAATASPGPAPAAGTPVVAPADKLRGIRGRITAEGASTWTLVTPRGRAVTVTLTPTTTFGTAASPSSAAQFAVGDTIAVRGTSTGATITAVRIAVPRTPSSPPTTNPGTTPSAPG